MIQDLGVLTRSAGLLAQCDRGTSGLGFMSDLVGSRWQLWPGDLSSEAVARGYLEVWAMTRGLEQWGCSQNMTGGLDQLWSFDWVTAIEQVWPGDLTVWPIVKWHDRGTWAPGWWQVSWQQSSQMTGGLEDQRFDRGTQQLFWIQ